MTKSWKTTVAGWLGAFLIAFGPTIGARLTGQPAPPITIGNILTGLAVAGVGTIAKDSNVTGV